MIVKQLAKIVGRAKLYSDTNGDITQMIPRYETSIYNNKEDLNFIYKLMTVGCIIDSAFSSRVYIILPKGWVHVYIDKNNEYIMDDQGRERIRLDRSKRVSTFLRRYDFIIQTASVLDGEEKKCVGVCQIIDSGKHIIKEYPITHEELKLYFDPNTSTDEELQELLKKAANLILDENYPNWRDELDYWDV